MTSPIVVKLGGLAVESPLEAAPLLRAIIDAARATPLVLVHGGGKAVDAHLARLGIVSERRQGLRVTSEAEIHQIVAVLAGTVNTAIVGALAALGASPVGLTLTDGRTGATATLRHAELGRVGEVTGGDPSLLRTLLAGGHLPVVAPIGHDPDGRPLNVNADDAAAGLAAILGARLLVLLTDTPGVLDAARAPIPSLDRAAAERLIEAGVITGGMIPKVRAALAAADRARAPAVIASWNDPSSLASVLRGEPAGTACIPPL